MLGTQFHPEFLSRHRLELPVGFGMAAERIAAAGLADRVTLLKTDYRDLTGTFDLGSGWGVVAHAGPANGQQRDLQTGARHGRAGGLEGLQPEELARARELALAKFADPQWTARVR